VEENGERGDLLRAYGLERDAWKAAGNYFTAEQLATMERGLSDLVIKPLPKIIYAAD
jgi:hypothetical protein